MTAVRQRLLHLLHGRPPSDFHRQVLDTSLILYAEHEFNASTFTARVAASTLTDMHSCITAAIGSLRGPLHGGANQRVVEMLDEIGRHAADVLAQQRGQRPQQGIEHQRMGRQQAGFGNPGRPAVTVQPAAEPGGQQIVGPHASCGGAGIGDVFAGGGNGGAEPAGC